MAANALDSNIQHAAVVNESGQRVITIVTDQHGNLQTTGGMTQPFFVTMQHGQQSMGRSTGEGSTWKPPFELMAVVLQCWPCPPTR